MKAFTQHSGKAVPLMRANVDTDAIMPKQFLKSIARTGYGDFVFDEWRYQDIGQPGMDCSKRLLNPDFILNEKAYLGASILIADENFGCGSSREHAPWGLVEYGFRAIIAPSFADIFYNNCTKNGLLPIVLPNTDVYAIAQWILQEPGRNVAIDLAEQTVHADKTYTFEIEPTLKKRLYEGLDDIALTLRHANTIKDFEARYFHKHPWLVSTFEDAQ